jgi:hypothetical protein
MRVAASARVSVRNVPGSCAWGLGYGLVTQISSIKSRPAPPCFGLCRLPRPITIVLILPAFTPVKLDNGIFHSVHSVAVTIAASGWTTVAVLPVLSVSVTYSLS